MVDLTARVTVVIHLLEGRKPTTSTSGCDGLGQKYAKEIMMRQGRFVALLVTLIVCQAVCVQRADASDADGTWTIRDLVLDIFDCQNRVRGRIAWIQNPGRWPTQCGRTIVWGLT